jgi:hypothetical protein
MQRGPKHHYIPVFYLKQWTGRDSLLCEYSRPYKEVKALRKYPHETAFEYGLYTLPTFPENVADVVERKLIGNLDNYACKALHLMLDNKIGQLEPIILSAWVRFIISLMRRTPEALTAIGAKVQESLDEIEALFPKSDSLTDEERKLRLFERHRALLLQSVINSPLIGTRLVNMRWFVIDFTGARHSLLTSDRPFVMTNGIGHPHSHIAIPISPNHVFLAAATPEEERKLRSIPPKDFMLQMNERMALQARKFVYGTDDSHLRFVQKRLGKKAHSYPFEEGG